jgi:hypothetical protein
VLSDFSQEMSQVAIGDSKCNAEEVGKMSAVIVELWEEALIPPLQADSRSQLKRRLPDSVLGTDPELGKCSGFWCEDEVSIRFREHLAATMLEPFLIHATSGANERAVA